MESKLKTAEWIVKHYALDKSYQHNHAVQDWLYAVSYTHLTLPTIAGG